MSAHTVNEETHFVSVFEDPDSDQYRVEFVANDEQQADFDLHRDDAPALFATQECAMHVAEWVLHNTPETARTVLSVQQRTYR